MESGSKGRLPAAHLLVWGVVVSLAGLTALIAAAPQDAATPIPIPDTPPAAARLPTP